VSDEVKPPTPFDFITAAGQTKINLLEDEQNEKFYVPFMINKGFSYFADTILYANEMNIHHELPKDAQFLYYRESLRPAKRFSKWFKPEKNDDLDMLRKKYSCSVEVAKQYLKILTEDQLKEIHEKTKTP
jgi:hypothetical protein